MEENKYTQFISKFRNEAEKFRSANTAISDDDMGQAVAPLMGSGTNVIIIQDQTFGLNHVQYNFLFILERLEERV